MADSDLTKAMAGMNVGGDKPEKETNGESCGLKQPVNGKDELDLSDKTYGYNRTCSMIIPESPGHIALQEDPPPRTFRSPPPSPRARPPPPATTASWRAR